MVEALLRLTRSRWWIAVIVAGIGLLCAAWVSYFGMHWGTDVGTYSAWADILIRSGFDYSDYLRDVRFVVPPVFYVGWVTVVAVAKVIAGSHWQQLLVALNCIAVMVTSWLVLSEVKRTTSSVAAVSVAGLLLANVEILLFVQFPLSDIVFLALVTAILVASLRVAEQRKPLLVIGGSAAVLMASVFRPTAAPIVVLWMTALVWPSLSARARRWMVPGLAVTIAIAILLHAAVMRDAGRWPFGFAQSWIDYLADHYRQGVIVCLKPDTWVASPESYGDTLAITMRRWAYFFAITVSGYSWRIAVMRACFLIPLYALSAVALLRRSVDPRRGTATTLLLLTVLMTSAFHAVQELDFNYRYRLPMLPALIILGALGAAEIVARLSKSSS